MPTTQIVLIASMLVNTLLGIALFVTNSRRSQNRQYFLFTFSLTLWGIFVLGIMNSTSKPMADWMIRLASAAAALAPLCFHFLCLSIQSPTTTLRGLITSSWRTVLIALGTGILCFTHFFMRDVIMPGTPGYTNAYPESVYGPGFSLFALYFPVAFGSIVYSFVKNMRHSRGAAYAELQFILLGVSTMVPLGVLVNLIPPLITGSSQSQQFGPISVVVMNLIIAYGIATHRIMGVEAILRRATAYTLLTAMLGLSYFLIWYFMEGICTGLSWLPKWIPHFLATVVIAFSMSPAHGFITRFADRLFIGRRVFSIADVMQQASKIFQSVTTLDALAADFSKLVLSVTQAAHFRILLQNGGSYTQLWTDAHNQQGMEIKADDILPQTLGATPEPLVLDMLQRLRPTEEIQRLARRMSDLQASMVVGIRAKGHVIGIAIFGPRLSGRLYDRSEQDALQIICNELSVAIENSRLYTEVQNSKIYNEILLDNLVNGVIAVNAEQVVTVFNREAQRITRLDAASILNHPLSTLPDPVVEVLQMTFLTGRGVRDSEVVIARADEEGIPVRMGSSIFRGHDGHVMGALLVFHDLTVFRKLEAQVRRTDRLASLGTLSAGMAHEIKNTLVTIKTFTQLLPERFDDAEFREVFSSLVGHEVTRIDSIVNQLLKFARPVKPSLVPAHLHTILQQTLRLSQQQMKQKGISVQEDLSAGSDLIMGDADLLTQAFINFYLNAVDAMESGGWITIHTETVKRPSAERDLWGEPAMTPVIRLSIQDTGQGIKPEDIARIFDPFFSTKANGTGLGLSVSYNIIQEHNGTIEVESTPGHGTTFYLTFPLIVKEVPV